MPKILIKKNNTSIHVSEGTNLRLELIANGIPVASSCAGDGVCAKCGIIIISGNENLSPVKEEEIHLKIKNQLNSQYRISCLVSIHGDITIDTPYW